MRSRLRAKSSANCRGQLYSAHTKILVGRAGPYHTRMLLKPNIMRQIKDFRFPEQTHTKRFPKQEGTSSRPYNFVAQEQIKTVIKKTVGVSWGCLNGFHHSIHKTYIRASGSVNPTTGAPLLPNLHLWYTLNARLHSLPFVDSSASLTSGIWKFMSAILIRKANRNDCSSILSLRADLAAAAVQNLQEKKASGLELISSKELENDGFKVDPPLFYCLVAEEQPSGNVGVICKEGSNYSASTSLRVKRIIGYAMYVIGYPIWVGKEINLQEFCVMKNCRERGVEKKLLQELAKIAIEGNYARISLDCLKSIPAAEFCLKNYGIDMTLAEGWHILHLSKDNVHRLTQS